jgi:methylated-DNA-[protein]-cysteine S-methyltransferase
MRTWFSILPSPVGPLLLVRSDGGLRGIYLHPHAGAPRPQPDWHEDPARFEGERAQLAEYFAGTRTRFHLALAPKGTAFQLQVWDALRAIPYGETTTYGTLARELGHPGAARAVGAANARNPLSIVVPCHRVIGAAGHLTGYAGGVARKAWLLEHEGRTAGSRPVQAPSHVAVHTKESVLAASFPLIPPAPA